MNERWKEAAISSSSASGSRDGPASRSSAKRGSVSAAAPKQQSTPGRTTSHVESESAAATSAASLTPPTDQKAASIAHALATRLADRVQRDACIAQRSTMPACTRPRSMHSPDELVRDAGERRGGGAHERHRERRQLGAVVEEHAQLWALEGVDFGFVGEDVAASGVDSESSMGCKFCPSTDGRANLRVESRDTPVRLRASQLAMFAVKNSRCSSTRSPCIDRRDARRASPPRPRARDCARRRRSSARREAMRPCAPPRCRRST